MIEIDYNIIVHVLNQLSLLFLPKYVDSACCFLHCSLLIGFAQGLPSMSIRQRVKLNEENCEAWSGMGLGGGKDMENGNLCMRPAAAITNWLF